MRSHYLHLLLIFSLPCAAQTNVLTQHNDKNRTGWYSHEKILTTGNVKIKSFGMIFSRSVDDQIYAQPLVMNNVDIPGAGKKNICFVATVNNTVYAFDADDINTPAPYWKINVSPAGGRAAKNTDIGSLCGTYNDFSGNMGIVGTPVIDSLTNTLYVVAKSYTTSSGFQQFLHAIDITTGSEKNGGPVLISPQIAGTGSGSIGGIIKFDALKQNQRSGLLLLNGIVYITWASHGDCDPYHGWIVGYDKQTLSLKIVFNSTPQGEKGGIWMAGAGIAADENGNMYVSVGNGTVGFNGNPSDLTNRGESALKLSPSGSTLSINTFFTPYNYSALEASDLDFGTPGILLIPKTNRAFTGAKDGNLYLLNRDDMGGYNSGFNQVLQTFNQNSSDAHNLSSLAYYGGTNNEYVYTWSDNVTLKAFPFIRSSGLFDFSNIKVNAASVQGPVGYNGAFLSVSSDRAIDSTAVLWVSHAASGNANQMTRPGILRAFKAGDVTQEIWNSSLNTSDNPGNYSKFNCPTIINGKVYLATFSNKLVVYGLRKNVVTGLERSSIEEPIIFPNPAKTTLTITLRTDQSFDIKIIDLNGTEVHSYYGIHSGEDIHISSIASGMYLIKITTSTKVFFEKIIFIN